MHAPTVVSRGVRLRVKEFREHAARHGLHSDADIAAKLGMHRTNVLRLLRGDIDPGTAFISAVLLDGFPGAKFEDFFSPMKVVATATEEAA